MDSPAANLIDDDDPRPVGPDSIEKYAFIGMAAGTGLAIVVAFVVFYLVFGAGIGLPVFSEFVFWPFFLSACTVCAGFAIGGWQGIGFWEYSDNIYQKRLKRWRASHPGQQ